MRRIYVRLPNWVGDVVLATPFLAAVRRAHPAAEIVVHGKGRLFEITDGGGFYDRAIPLERRWGPLAPYLEGRRVKALLGDCDLAFVLPNSLSSSLVAWFSGAKRRVGYALDARSALLTDALPVKKEGRLRPIPMVDYYLGLLAATGAAPVPGPKVPTLPVTEESRRRVDDLLAKVGVRRDERIWALNAGGAWETKRWIPEYVGQLADLAVARGARPFVLRGPDEQDIVDRALKSAKTPFLGADTLVPLRDLAAFLQRCEILVTTDSGPRHFGIAAGIPVVVLIGSTHPGYTVVADYPHVRVLCEEVECWPCHLEKCPIDFRCMTRLVPEKVARACDDLLAQRAVR